VELKFSSQPAPRSTSWFEGFKFGFGKPTTSGMDALPNSLSLEDNFDVGLSDDAPPILKGHAKRPPMLPVSTQTPPDTTVYLSDTESSKRLVNF
jgi:hypothetical protein